MFLLLLSLALLSQLIYTIVKLKAALHILQLNSYRNARYWRWLRGKLLMAFVGQDLWPLVSVIVLVTGGIYFSLLVFVTICLAFLIQYFVNSKLPAKKPLKFTPRLMRLYVLSSFLLLIINSGLWVLVWRYPNRWFDTVVFLTLLNFFLPLFLLLTNFLIKPLEKIIDVWYIKDAHKILASSSDLKIIGITGSFGKTSTKHILYEILRHKFATLMTPGSYNTPMGICKVIRSELKNTHQVFVVEMSAKEVGDIKEICDFVQPSLGILTAVGPQHLETFKTIENVKRTKNELIEALPSDGLAFFNMDNQYCRELAALTKKKAIRFGLDNSRNDLDYFVTDIEITGQGSVFTVHKANVDIATFQTKLLGEHNIGNILAAIAVAHEMGVTFQEMIYPVRKLAPIEHRLQLRPGERGALIIDDAFNANPVGSKMALAVLAKIPGNKKIIITPGMIELGIEEDTFNKEFGANIAKICDYVILVGEKQTHAIQAGLKAQNFLQAKLYIAHSFNEAYQHLQTIVAAGDVVLLENDLPDDY